MRRFTFNFLVLGSALLMSAGAIARAQDVGTKPKRVFGFLDPKTGAFVAASPMARPDAATTPATTGKISLTISMKLATAFPAKSTITCGLNLVVLSVSENTTTFAISEGEWLETAASAATISGSTATCTVSVPYAWVLPSSGSTVTTTNTLSASFQVTVANATSTPTVLRISQQDLIVGENVPVTGAVSSYTANVTL
jgi:hypothetical protein